MSYKLEYPYTEQERLDFIVQYNHQQGLRIETVDNIIEEERAREITEEREILDEEGNVIGTETVVVATEVYYEAVNYPTHYALEANEIMEGGEPVINPNYEAEQEQKEKERIAKLTCTKRVFALMLQELGITYTMLKQLIATNEQAQLEWDLCVELERQNPLLDVMAMQLGITSEQLDGLFRYANGELTIDEFRALYVKTDEELLTDEIVEQEGNAEVEDDNTDNLS